jgi:hypothetical protein
MTKSMWKLDTNGATVEFLETAGNASLLIDGVAISEGTVGGAVADAAAITASDAAAITASDAAAATALDPPAGGTGATAGAYDTGANRDLMITSQTAIIADVLDIRTEFNLALDDAIDIQAEFNLSLDDSIDIRTQLNALLASLRAANIIAT